MKIWLWSEWHKSGTSRNRLYEWMWIWKGCGCGWVVDVMVTSAGKISNAYAGTKRAIYNIVFIYANKSGENKKWTKREKQKKRENNARKGKKQKWENIWMNVCFYINILSRGKFFCIRQNKQINKIKSYFSFSSQAVCMVDLCVLYKLFLVIFFFLVYFLRNWCMLEAHIRPGYHSRTSFDWILKRLCIRWKFLLLPRSTRQWSQPSALFSNVK